MQYISKILGMLIIFFCTSPRNCFPNAAKQNEMAPSEIFVLCEPINVNNGTSTVGFRIELINASTNRNILMGAEPMPTIQLMNEDGFYVSPAPKMLPKGKSKESQIRRYLTLSPGTSHSWFVSVPREIISDPTKLTGREKLQMIQEGEYKAEIHVSFAYFPTDTEGKTYPKYPDYQSLRMDFTAIAISVSPEMLNLNIAEVYMGQMNRKGHLLVRKERGQERGHPE